MTTFSQGPFGGGPFSADDTTNVLNAWGFEFSGHSFYVLNLGRFGTFALDLTTGQWSEWAGYNRVALHTAFGTQSDDTPVMLSHTGTLLKMVQADKDYDGPLQCYATGGYPVRGRNGEPCFDLFLSGMLSGYAAGTMKLYYSDDTGVTWRQADPTINANGEARWSSLGMMNPPMRAFCIADESKYRQIFNLNVDDGSGD